MKLHFKPMQYTDHCFLGLFYIHHSQIFWFHLINFSFSFCHHFSSILSNSNNLDATLLWPFSWDQFPSIAQLQFHSNQFCFLWVVSAYLHQQVPIVEEVEAIDLNWVSLSISFLFLFCFPSPFWDIMPNQ